LLIDSSAVRQAKQDLNALAQSGPAVEQALGHLKDKATTEIYIKQRWRESVPSNSRKISA